MDQKSNDVAFKRILVFFLDKIRHRKCVKSTKSPYATCWITMVSFSNKNGVHIAAANGS